MTNFLPKALCIATLLILPVAFQPPALANDEPTAKQEHHFHKHHRPTARVARPAPDFSLEGVVSTEADKEFRKVSLGDYRGKWLVLFFYPADFTFVCPTEIRGFNASLDAFKKLGAEIVGVSTDSKFSHLACTIHCWPTSPRKPPGIMASSTKIPG
jgi:peroxiredoxin (alkyl hydroperoxide reductase subunit C)